MADLQWVRAYEQGADYTESLGGISWADAPLPYPWHQCKPQTRGWFSLHYVERCACGAIRDAVSGSWFERNQTRKDRRRQRQDERAPKESVKCGECGQSYEAVAGSVIAQARQCPDCWAADLVREHRNA